MCEMVICYFFKCFRDIDKEKQKNYHIVDENMRVYSSMLKVWEVHKKKLTPDNVSLMHAHMELVNFNYNLLDRQIWYLYGKKSKQQKRICAC